ncbi:type I secretion system permease/ATPase [Burkholderiaceae bacterium]|nr:type I secretion system permease/ATPase [Burkholderiaceae bacterium]
MKQTYSYSFADVVAVVTAALGQSVTPAEIRALEVSNESEWSETELVDILGARGLSVSSVPLEYLSTEIQKVLGKEVLYLALSSNSAFMLSWDDAIKKTKCLNLLDQFSLTYLDDFSQFEGGETDRAFFQIKRDTAENLAFVPGVEKHWFWSTIWKNRSSYTHAAIASLVTNLFALGTSLFSMIVYNRVIPSNAMSSLLVLVSGMVLVLLVDYLTRSIRNKFLSVAGVDSDLTLADRLFSRVLDLKFESRKGSVGALANTLKEFEHIREFFASATLVSMIDVPFAFVFLFAMYLIGGLMVLPVLAGILILVAATLYVQPRLKALAKHSFEDGQSKHSVLVESLTGLETLKLVGAGGFMRRRLRAVLERQADVSEQMKTDTHFITNISQTVQQLVQMFVVTVGAVLVTTGEFGYGAIIACTILSGKALAPFAQLTQILVRLNQIGVSYGALSDLMGQPVEHPEEKSFLPRRKFKGDVELRDVTFSYPDQQSPVIQNVSFKVEAGERVAILGHIGSGKTTIGRLLAGLYEPQDGKILVDNIDIKQIAPADLRENLGISMQDVWLMSSTLESNISLGAVEVSTEDVLRAAKIAGVSDFADKHPDGFKMLMKERGESLSGGQRQAVSLARSLARRPQIIILDEPTSSMDSRSEQLFVKRFKEELPDATLILITHRTSLLSLVDRVIIMENGRVAGMGTTEQFAKAQTDRGVAGEIISNAVKANNRGNT